MMSGEYAIQIYIKVLNMIKTFIRGILCIVQYIIKTEKSKQKFV